MFPCKNFSYYPQFARATSNSLCIAPKNAKKNNLFASTKLVKIGDISYRIPCFLLNHIEELEILLKTMTIKEAIIFLADKYNISLRRIQNIKRYIYPTVGGKSVPKPIQFKVSFKLMDITSLDTPPPSFNNSVSFTGDTREVFICNDDTKTFSSFASKSGYWASTLPDFTKSSYYYAVISSTNLLNAHTGLLILQTNGLVFLPVIHKDLLFLYQPYSTGTPFIFLYIGLNGDTPLTIIQNLYIPQQASCIYGLVKT
jgi:hypothetical protein